MMLKPRAYTAIYTALCRGSWLARSVVRNERAATTGCRIHDNRSGQSVCLKSLAQNNNPSNSDDRDVGSLISTFSFSSQSVIRRVFACVCVFKVRTSHFPLNRDRSGHFSMMAEYILTVDI